MGIPDISHDVLLRVAKILKADAPNFSGYVQFNLDAKQAHPKINILHADVTEVKQRDGPKHGR